jgi:predicted lysophospholipase L1 biosynthesis ABC-type transport system permease subunit
VSEYAATAFFAWLVGGLSAVAISWSVTSQIFEINSRVSWLAIFGSGVVILALTAGIAHWSCGFVLGLRGTSRKL